MLIHRFGGSSPGLRTAADAGIPPEAALSAFLFYVKIIRNRIAQGKRKKKPLPLLTFYDEKSGIRPAEAGLGRPDPAEQEEHSYMTDCELGLRTITPYEEDRWRCGASGTSAEAEHGHGGENHG